jgi:hypothetical protein
MNFFVLVYERAAWSMYVGSVILDCLLNSSYGVLPLYVVAYMARIGVPKDSVHTNSAPQNAVIFQQFS